MDYLQRDENAANVGSRGLSQNINRIIDLARVLPSEPYASFESKVLAQY